MNDVNVKNLTVLAERRRNLRPAVVLFHFLAEKTDALNCIHLSKGALAERFHVNERTVANWLYALADVGAIKYKYSGIIRLNPIIYYVGTRKNYKKALSEYETFRSDI